MKIRRQISLRGTTLLEMLFVTLIIGILMIMALPVIQRSQAKGKQANCISRLRQVGVASHLFAHDHEEQFPFQVAVTNGGTLELVKSTLSAGESYFAYRQFQALSNELADPRLFTCPADLQRTQALDMVSLQNANISYFLDLGAKYGNPESVLYGDRNVLVDGTLPAAHAWIYDRTDVQWSRYIHEYRGNVAYSDGRVDGVSGLELKLALVRRGGTRLIFPLTPRLGWPAESIPNQTAGTRASGSQARPSGFGDSAGTSSSAQGSSNTPSAFAVLQHAFAVGSTFGPSDGMSELPKSPSSGAAGAGNGPVTNRPVQNRIPVPAVPLKAGPSMQPELSTHGKASEAPLLGSTASTAPVESGRRHGIGWALALMVLLVIAALGLRAWRGKPRPKGASR